MVDIASGQILEGQSLFAMRNFQVNIINIMGDKMINYDKLAEDFLKKTGTDFKAVRVGFGKYFPDDTESRDIYEITLIRKGKKPFIFSFGQSLRNSGTIDKNYETSKEFDRSGRMIPTSERDFERKRKAPSAYDVLASLTKCNPGSFDNFCSDFGYDIHSIQAKKIYLDVQKEFSEVKSIFGDVLEKLSKIN